MQTLAPLVEQYRDEGERLRRLPTPLAEALREAELFSVWVPRNLGAEVDVETSMPVPGIILVGRQSSGSA